MTAFLFIAGWLLIGTITLLACKKAWGPAPDNSTYVWTILMGPIAALVAIRIYLTGGMK